MGKNATKSFRNSHEEPWKMAPYRRIFGGGGLQDAYCAFKSNILQIFCLGIGLISTSYMRIWVAKFTISSIYASRFKVRDFRLNIIPGERVMRKQLRNHIIMHVVTSQFNMMKIYGSLSRIFFLQNYNQRDASR